MKVCLACGAQPDERWACPACGWEVARLNGFPAFAPALALSGDGFRSEYFSGLAAQEETHFWFRARNRLIIWALGHHFPAISSFLEIGCGTGYVLSGIASAFPGLYLSGSDIFSVGLGFASVRAPNAELFQLDACAIPFDDEFDVVGAFDVLEHIVDDTNVLNNLFRAVKPGGGIILTVPQHRWLWSAVDEDACHVRRYDANELHEKICKAGFEIIQSTSFVSTLLPAMCLSRLMQRDKIDASMDAMAELHINPILNKLFEWILNFELVLIRFGVSLPVGGSRLLVARKPMMFPKDV